MEAIAENLWVMRFPQSLLGAEIGRTVTIVRLASGELVVHSTAPFSANDVAAINALGKVRWMLDATNFHDTFAAKGAAAFPEAVYLAPDGFSFQGKATPLGKVPAEWRGELEVIPLGGMPSLNEHAFFHVPSKTLILADLLFTFGPTASGWTRFLFRFASGIKAYPAMSRLFKAQIKDQASFEDSLKRLLALPFERVIVGHGEIIESGAKAIVARALGQSI